MDKYYVATFYSTSQALRFEKSMLQQALSVKMIPVPRIISSSCGLAARFTEADWLPLLRHLLPVLLKQKKFICLLPQANPAAGVWARDNE